MTIEYKWIISSMDTKPSENGLTDVVKTVHWRRQAIEISGDTIYYADLYDSLLCSAPDPMSFKPYNELTFEDVCGWLESKLDVSKLDLSLESLIENKKNPPIVSLELPWIKKEEYVNGQPVTEQTNSLPTPKDSEPI